MYYIYNFLSVQNAGNYSSCYTIHLRLQGYNAIHSFGWYPLSHSSKYHGIIIQEPSSLSKLIIPPVQSTNRLTSQTFLISSLFIFTGPIPPSQSIDLAGHFINLRSQPTDVLNRSINIPSKCFNITDQFVDLPYHSMSLLFTP